MKAQSYLNICGVPTKVVTWGKGLADVNATEQAQDIVLVIPGNPGYTPFYDEFLEEIYKGLGYSLWIIGHAGHEIPKDAYHIIPSLAGNEALYDVNGQVTHKITFIEQYVPANTRLHLIGHSIGAYIIIQLLKVPAIKSRVIGSYMLFPVFERLSESPNGIIIQKLITFPWIGEFLAHLFIFLPVVCQTFLMEAFGPLVAIPKQYRSICREVIHPNIIQKVIAMVSSELYVLKDRDNETLKANKDKIKMYYGAMDGYTPQDFYFQLKQDLPEVDAELCSHNYPHAFVLQHSKQIANLVVDWIQMKKL